MKYIAPIAVELLVREAQSLRGYDAHDWRSLRLVAIEQELYRLGASDVIDLMDEEDEDDDYTFQNWDSSTLETLDREDDPAFNGAFNRW